MGEEGGRKPSLDNPEYFLFPEDPATFDGDPANPDNMARNPGEPATIMDRFHGEAACATMNRFRGEPVVTATMDRRARTVSQVNNVKLGKGQIIQFKHYVFL